MEKKGVVKEVSGKKVTVSLFLDESCRSCGMCAGCSDGVFERELFKWEVKNGDGVIITTESEYGKVVFLIYLFPIFMMIAGYYAGTLSGKEWIALMGAALCFMVSFPLIRILGRRVTSRARVTVVQERGE